MPLAEHCSVKITSLRVARIKIDDGFIGCVAGGRKRSDLSREELSSEKAVAFYLTEWNRKNLSNLNGRKESYKIAGGTACYAPKLRISFAGNCFSLCCLISSSYFTLPPTQSLSKSSRQVFPNQTLRTFLHLCEIWDQFNLGQKPYDGVQAVDSYFEWVKQRS